jgi:hypothetical protein
MPGRDYSSSRSSTLGELAADFEAFPAQLAAFHGPHDQGVCLPGVLENPLASIVQMERTTETFQIILDIKA